MLRQVLLQCVHMLIHLSHAVAALLARGVACAVERARQPAHMCPADRLATRRTLPGFMSAADVNECADEKLNECTVDDGIAADVSTCTDKNGTNPGYTCGCEGNYKLDSQGYKCLGKNMPARTGALT